VLILHDFKSVGMDVLIPQELRTKFAQTLILQGLLFSLRICARSPDLAPSGVNVVLAGAPRAV
jgi:hypothetical protein